MPTAVWQQTSKLVAARVKATVLSLPLRSAALYACIERLREVDLTELDPWLRSRGVRLAYPVMHQTQRGFAWVSDTQTLQVRAPSFRQPAHPWDLVEPGELDLIVVPMLGFSPDLNRIGYGAGFYDEALHRFRPPALALGVAFSEQAVASLPIEAHDERCDVILTEHHQYGQLP